MVIRHVGTASTRALLAQVRRPLTQAAQRLSPFKAPSPSELPSPAQDEPLPFPEDHGAPDPAWVEPALDQAALEAQEQNQEQDQVRDYDHDQALPDAQMPEPQALDAGEEPDTPSPSTLETDFAALQAVAEHIAEPPHAAPQAAAEPPPAVQFAGDMSQVRLGGPPPSDQVGATDYHSIICGTIDALPRNTPSKRREVYDHAFVVVHQRLTRIRPPLGSFVIAREELALERAIKKIEEEHLARFPDAMEDDEPFFPDAPERPFGDVLPEHMADADVPEHVPDEPAPGEFAAPEPERFPVPSVRAPAARPRKKRKSQTYGLMLRTVGLVATIAVAVCGYWVVTRSYTYLTQRSAAVSEGLRGMQPTGEVAARFDTGQVRAVSTARAAVGPNAVVRGPEDILSVCQRAVSPNEFLLCSGAGIAPTGAAGSVEQKLPFWVSTFYNAFDAPQQRPNDTTVVLPPANSAVPVARERFDSAMMRLRRDDVDRAINDLSDAIRADPQFADAYLQRGQALFKSGDADRAVADFSAALTIDTRHAAAYKARGMAMLYKGDDDAAIRDLTSAIQYTDLDRSRLPAIEVFYARRSRAMLYDRRQQFDNEIADLTAMIDGYWKNQILVAALRLTYREQGSVSLMASIYRMRANVYLKRGNIDGAIADLSFALQLDPQRQLALLLERARVQEGAGRRPQAAADFGKALELAPNNDEAKAGAARLRGAT
jgi:tetratricopeptide (TPR) repeat protein